MHCASRNGNLSQCGDAPTSSVCRGDVDGLVRCICRGIVGLGRLLLMRRDAEVMEWYYSSFIGLWWTSTVQMVDESCIAHNADDSGRRGLNGLGLCTVPRCPLRPTPILSSLLKYSSSRSGYVGPDRARIFVAIRTSPHISSHYP